MPDETASGTTSAFARLNHLRLNVGTVKSRFDSWKSRVALAQKLEKDVKSEAPPKKFTRPYLRVKKSDLKSSPIELAVLAMAHHKLGDQKKAAEYQTKLNEAMKLEAYRNDADSKSFFCGS